MATAVNFPNILGGGSVYIVASQRNDRAGINYDSGGAFLGAGSSVNMQIQRGDNDAIAGGIGTSLATQIEQAGLNNDQFYTIRLRSDGTTMYLSINNGTEVSGTDSGASYSATPLTVFKTLGAARGDKQIAEILIYTANHNSTERTQVEDYLKDKYAHY
jgi:hypothetical protein